MGASTQKTAGHLLTGQRGEKLAADYLHGLGLEVLDRNWRPSGIASALEIDLVARGKDLLLFVEVKTRTHKPGTAFTPQDSFTPAKGRKLLRAASLYLEERSLWRQPCRFDLICVSLPLAGTEGSAPTLEHFKNVLSFQSAGRGTAAGLHTPWQPW
ncbi:MAG: YraN family protein [Desulfovibrionaceae bacterium]|nr:YraN family protein [Desulfovibrionaceae bacterium]